MTQLNGGQKEFARVVADNYSMMEEQLQEAATKNHNLLVENGILLAERDLLREQLDEALREAKRAQAVASTFGGQARALQSVIGTIIELAIKNGYEAADAPQKPVQRPAETVAPEPPKAAGVSVDPLHVDWSRLPQGSGNGNG